MEELQSALGNHGLTISNLPEKGRCILTTKDFNPGEVIIRVDPYVCVPDNSVTEHYCDACFESTNLKKCSGCKTVYYCSSTCQKAEWKLHRLECEAFSKLPIQFHSQITPPIRLNIRLHFRSKLESQKIIPASAMDNYNLVKALVAHMSKIDEEKRRMYVDLVNRVNLILPDINRKEIVKNFSKIAFNNQAIYAGGFKHVGRGLYPAISFMNHSCLPNCIVVNEGRTAVVCAVQHIPKGAEIDTATKKNAKNMRDTFLPAHVPAALKWVSMMISMKVQFWKACTDNECDGLLLCDSDDNGFICQQCGRLKSKEEISKMESEIKSLQEKALKAEQSACSHIDTWEKISVNSTKLEDWSEALAYCRLSIALYQRVYPGYHPLLGLHHYTCGKLEGILGEDESAVKSLTKAADILQISYGTSTSFMKDVFRSLKEQHDWNSRQKARRGLGGP
ncbi:hypothetical protein ACLB2K_010391 [Fragaria x ananassa]